jgi:FkbM family methyltransferase
MSIKVRLINRLIRLLGGQSVPPQKLKIDHLLHSQYVKKSLPSDAIYVEIGPATGLGSCEKIAEWGLLPKNAYLVEGCPKNCAVMRKKLSEFNILNYVVSGVVGQTKFYVVDDHEEPGSSRSNSLDRQSIEAKRPGQHIQEILVPSITMDHLFHTIGINKCDYLFFNCEGAEYDIFTGECKFLTETHLLSLDLHKGLYGDAKTKGDMIDRKLQIYQLLENKGFTRIGGHSRDDIHRLSDYHLTSFWENQTL